MTNDDANLIPTFDWSDISERNAANETMRKGKPAVLRNTKIATGSDGATESLVETWGGGLADTDEDSMSKQSETLFKHFAKTSKNDKRKWRVMLSGTSPTARNRFFPIVQGHNGYGLHYRVRQPETSVTRLSVNEFVGCAREWENRGAYLEDEVAALWRDDTGSADSGDTVPGNNVTPPTHNVRPVNDGDGLGTAVVDALNWQSVSQIASGQKFGDFKSVLVGAGTRNSLIPMSVPTGSGIKGGALSVDSKSTFESSSTTHKPDQTSGLLDSQPSKIVPDTHGLTISDFDIKAIEKAEEASLAARDDSGFETLQVQVVGRRKIVLVNPDLTYRGVYPYPVTHPLDGRSMVDWGNDVDYEKFPNAANVKGQVCITRPGDVLFVPEGWWRMEQGLSVGHVHVQLRFARSNIGSGGRYHAGCGIFTGDQPTSTTIPADFAIGRSRNKDASVLFVGRAVEKRMCDEEGSQKAKQWLEIIALGEETLWCDLSTVQGSRRVEVARRIREEIDFGLPAPRVSAEAFRKQLQAEFMGGGNALNPNNPNPKVIKSPELDLVANPEEDVTPFDSETELIPAPPRHVSVLTLASHRELRGKGRYERFILDLIDGRMMPTPWLDAGFIDPLFVSEAMKQLSTSEQSEGGESNTNALTKKDSTQFQLTLPNGGVLTQQSKQLPDDRSDVEKQFPEMFVDRLAKKGWTETKHTPLSVLNPEHPQFVGKK